ncbi:HRDC domain-containing protein [Ammoniphilus oxalaticus]|nr:HRDC domain-containing protein [Ammoniphilus oxalaticus]
MIENIEYVVTLDKPHGERGKMMLLQRDGAFETQWSLLGTDEEELSIQYAGPSLELAWQAAETLILDKIKQGYQLHNPFIPHLLETLSPRFTLSRKMGYYAAQHFNPSLYKELKEWRRSAAATNKLPPYIIATDKLLTLLAAFIPHQDQQLEQLPGVGEQRKAQYGAEILEITKKYEQPRPFPLGWVEEEVRWDTLAFWMISEHRLQKQKRQLRTEQERDERVHLLQLIKAATPIEEAIKQLNLSMEIVLKRIQQLAEMGYDPLEYVKSQVAAIQERQQITELVARLGGERLKPIYTQLYGTDEEGVERSEVGERYNRIRLVRAYLSWSEADKSSRALKGEVV